MAVNEQSRFRPNPSVYARAFGDELVLLEFGRGEYFGLDPIGADIWRAVEGGADVGTIVDGLVARYDVARDDVLRDTLALLAQMCAENLLVPA